MRKLICVILLSFFLVVVVGCGSETVNLHCDSDNCDNTVTVKVKKDEKPDESWVVFCEDCSKGVLAD